MWRLPYLVRIVTVPAWRIADNLNPSQQEQSERAEWFRQLEASVRRDGIRNPVVLTARWNDPAGQDGLALTARYGGSRILMAKRLGLDVPAVVADFNNWFPRTETLHADGPAEMAALVAERYLDKPKKIIFKPHGINMSGCADSHLDGVALDDVLDGVEVGRGTIVETDAGKIGTGRVLDRNGHVVADVVGLDADAEVRLRQSPADQDQEITR